MENIKYLRMEAPRNCIKQTDITKVTGLNKATIQETIKLYKDLDEDTKELLRSANKVRQNAYAPYSNFKVGAAFRTKCGEIFTGCNVENAAFTPGSCAERTALVKAVSEGATEFVAGAVVAYQADSFTTPCGVCRQFIMEFAAKDMPIYCVKAVEPKNPECNDDLENEPSDKVLCTSIYTLLPNGFRNYK